MKFLTFSVVLIVSVCLANCWRVFPLENEPIDAKSDVSSPLPKIAPTPVAFTSTTKVKDVKLEVTTAKVAPTTARAPKAYVAAEAISPPSIDLLPPKEGPPNDYTIY